MPHQFKQFLALLLVAGVCLHGRALADEADISSDEDYRRATEDPDNVKNKLFTKAKRVELSLLNFGSIINQSYLTTYLTHGGLTYYTSEEWGFSLEGSYGFNVDKNERHCIENFYNDPDRVLGSVCQGKEGEPSAIPDEGEENADRVNYGPAYVPIREINYIVSVNAVWNPVYGKQLLALRSTSYFDVFFTAGLGMVASTYYPKSTKLRNGKNAKAVCNREEGQDEGPCDFQGNGASKSQSDLYGKAGRPDPESQNNAMFNLGIGQKYHFWNRYSFKLEFRNMLLLGTPGGYENLFAIWGGFGARF
jgi:outer membrane beta-barrel protein